MAVRQGRSESSAHGAARAWRLAAAVACCWALPCALFVPGLAAGRVLFWHDVTITLLPQRIWAAQSLRSGHLPHLCPYIGGGSPILAEGQAGVFYPFNLVEYLLPVDTVRGYTAQCLLHFGLAATFMLLWLHLRHELRLIAALLAAICYSVSGFFVGHVMHLHMIQIAAWAPLVLWQAEKLAEAPNAVPAAALAALVGICGLAGHPQMFFFTLMAAALWWAASLKRGRLAAKAGAIAGALALGVALAAVQVVPTAAHARASEQREGRGLGYLTMYSLLPRSFAYFLHPEIFGAYATGDYFGGEHQYEVLGWVGGACLLLALAGLSSSRRLKWAAVAFIAVGLFLGMAKHNPLYPLIAKLPPFSVMRGMGRMVFFMVIGLCVLGALGLDELLSGGRRAGRRILVASGIAACFWLLAPLGLRAARPALERALRPEALRRAGGDEAVAREKVEEKLRLWSRKLSPIDPYVAVWLLTCLAAAGLARRPNSAWAWLVVGASAAHLWLLGRDYNPWIEPSFYEAGRQTAAFMRRHAPPSEAKANAVSWPLVFIDPSLRCFERPPAWRGRMQSSEFKAWARSFFACLRPAANAFAPVAVLNNPFPLASARLWDFTERELPRMLDEPSGRDVEAVLANLGVRWAIVAPEHAKLFRDSAQWNLPGSAGTAVLVRLPRGPSGRAWLAEARSVGPAGDALQAVLGCRRWPVAYVEGQAGGESTGSRVSASVHGSMVRASVSVPEARGGLVAFSIAYHPGWRAWIDGKPAKLLRANHCLAAVEVPPGKHQIELRFSTPGLKKGAAVSGLAALLLLALCAAGWMSRAGRR